MDKKTLVQKYRGAVSVLCGLHNLPSRLAVRSHGRQNRVIAPAALLRHVKIHISGNNNQVLIGDFSRLTDVEIYISGNDNVVQVGAWCTLVKTVFCLEDSGNRITVGEGSRLLGAAELAAIEVLLFKLERTACFPVKFSSVQGTLTPCWMRPESGSTVPGTFRWRIMCGSAEELPFSRAQRSGRTAWLVPVPW